MAVITKTDPPQFYAVKLTRGGPRCPCKAWYGVPDDPVTGEPLDRAARWQCVINGEFVDPLKTIMLVGDVGYVKGEPIDEAEYRHLLNVREWAETHAPDAPEANPREKIDLNKQKPIF